MTIQSDHDREEEMIRAEVAPGSWLAATTAISVLVVATVTLTLLAGGVFSPLG
jgi:hypothetical protein